MVGGSPAYNHSESTTWSEILTDKYEIPLYKYTLGDGAVAMAAPAIETFNAGGMLYSDIGFGQLYNYDPVNSGQIMPFGGASGIIGLNTDMSQTSGQSSFMYTIKDQLTGKPHLEAASDCTLTVNAEWKCSIDLFRESQNGIWDFGSVESVGDVLI